MAVSDPYAAYCLDEVVVTFGSYVEGELHEAAKGAKNDKAAARKRAMRMQTLLNEDEYVVKGSVEEGQPALPKKAAPTKFRDPAEVLGLTKK